MTAYRPPWMNEELEILREAAARFFAAEAVPHERRWEAQHHIDREFWTKAGAAGLLCPSIPEEYGGAGGDFRHEAVIYEEQIRALVSSFGNGVHSGIVAHYVLAYGTEAQKKRWLPKLATGELVGAIAMSEPGAGSDLQGVRTRATRTADGYAIEGAKTFITNGFLADLIVLVAKTDPSLGAKGISLIAVETRDLAGFRRGRILEKIGMHGQDTAELFFDGAQVPAANLLGGIEGQGFVQLMQQLPQERLIVAIQALAGMERAVELTAEYVKGRKAFGKLLMEMQNTRFKLAECATEAHIARVFIDDCIGRHATGALDTATASMAKWWCTQKQCDVVDECLQLHGGYGYMREYPISRLYVDARVAKIYGGSNEIMKELIARAL
ncbi:MAG: acyl-CoA dehydrogenase family protein [Gammaproteobacteria bacterium]